MVESDRPHEPTTLDERGVAAALDAAATRLHTEFDGQRDEQQIRAMLDKAYEAVAAEAAVASFLPLLAERRVRKALTKPEGA